MTQLLISVRNVEEARLAYQAGADLIDLKEPLRGSLGAAEPPDVLAVVREFAGLVPLSAALGELLDPRPPLSAADVTGLNYAKFGLAGCATRGDWVKLWEEKILEFPHGVTPVAVAYADVAAASPAPKEILSMAAAVGAPVVLVDTYNKEFGPLLAHWTLIEVQRFVDRVHAAGLKIALAGSLDTAAIEQLLPLGPDIFAVRGAACQTGRKGTIDSALVRELAALVHNNTLVV